VPGTQSCFMECESLLFLPERRLFLLGDSSTGPEFLPLSSSMNLMSICFMEVEMMFLSSSEAYGNNLKRGSSVVAVCSSRLTAVSLYLEHRVTKLEPKLLLNY